MIVESPQHDILENDDQLEEKVFLDTLFVFVWFLIMFQLLSTGLFWANLFELHRECKKTLGQGKSNSKPFSLISQLPRLKKRLSSCGLKMIQSTMASDWR